MRRRVQEYISTLLIGTIAVSLISAGCSFLGIPSANNLNELQFVEATQVYDIHGNLIAKLFEENRVVVSLQQISPYIPQALIANEDSRFYSHIGIDPIGILRAVWVNIRSGGIVEGGSTITQQLARNMFLTQEQTLTRKIKEAILSLMIERKFTKQEIMQAYLNQVYFGEGAYGVEAAAQVYYGKSAGDLSLAEGALLAGIIRGPNIYSPYIDMDAAQKRRSVVLSGMGKAGFISTEQMKEADAEPIVLAGKKKRTVQASYFLDYIAQDLVGRYGANRVYKGGLKIYTTLDIQMQQVAEGVLGQYQGAVLIMDPRNGYIKAMVGGRNYAESQINRVVSEVRQPGSAFKPFVYTVALQQGYAANSVMTDEAININGYQPQNYDKKYIGSTTLKKALRLSINVIAVKLAQQVQMSNVLDLAKRMDITTLVPQDNNLASALGGLTQGVNLMEVTTAYTAFANSGILSKPIAILQVLDENGQVLEQSQIIQKPVLEPAIAYIITDMLQSVLQKGTGMGANLGRPAAGKTGTTDDAKTAWFIGYTPELLAGIYIGNDDRKSVGITGSHVAIMWGQMMAKIVAGTPVEDFTLPPDVIAGVPVCTDSGHLASGKCKEVEYSAFVKGTEPKAFSPPRKRSFREDIPQPAPQQPQEKRKPVWRLPWLRLPGF
ncbi:transglycosylase domain-containing protein [Acetonema longum]|uniref:Penicillin-binding protein, 1A family n=1 Tax=Acetonema longum DSM 6540 TaxID=1009370 RepID=F7NPC1_9FIRM|nr:PBP1A family penicillin-binding protein [Acetonema longum]EGO62083.1 penicillin-binding protein, 1A family [Acetonema longum DSM 6540]